MTAEKTSFIFLLKNGPVFWSHQGHTCYICACLFIFHSISLDIIRLHWGSALTSIVRGDALIDNAILQLNVFCVGTLTFDTKTILSP